MASMIIANRKELSKSHYIRLATSDNYWFDFSHTRVSKYLGLTGGNFCLVVCGSASNDDAYIIPYSVLSPVLTDLGIDNRGRWVGTITNDILKIHASGQSLIVSEYYNKLELLTLDRPTEGAEDVFVYDEVLGGEEPRIRGYILAFDEKYKTSVPIKQIVLSERVARPGLISEYIKKLRGYCCQICRVPGFQKRNGGFYAEAHHVFELHRLLPGSLCSDNILVVCPTCHRRLHYSESEFRISDSGTVEIKFGSDPWVQVTDFGVDRE